MLEKLSQKSPKPCIFKVPNYLRQVKEMAYAPQVIGIGPYHRGNEDRLKAMEELKIRFLQKLIEETKETDISRYVLKMRELEERARKCYAEPCMPGKGRPKGDLKFKEIEIRHLLDFIHRCCCHPSSFEMKSYAKNKNLDWKFIRCATELQEAGITFKKVDGKSMFDIKFENGTLQIPELKIGDHTEPLLRNLIAFEQLFLSDMHLFHSDNSLKHVTDYMVFMNHLIDSPKDVEILCQHGIIKHTLGDDEAVATMINSLGAFVIYSDSFYSSNFYYAMVFNQINDYCSRRWNKRMANLKHNYFNSPWALISFLAALLLLILTVLQSVFSVLSYAG
ncbi:hypothetical protein COLO4_20323 [Corchorus olitorius]|uniref:Uncharacterized protein n=1 Tax=Corchorus olitorius TaxID=93759 RepID=A0A1R3J0H0_9ROSI|nr:hypothetical protein COLO4_20323 [Corchorus olitorius]